MHLKNKSLLSCWVSVPILIFSSLTLVSAKTPGQHNGSLEVGADFVLTKDFIFNLKAEYGLAESGDEYSYGGGFRLQF